MSFQGGSGTELEPEIGTTKTAVQEPKQKEPEPCLSLTAVQNIIRYIVKTILQQNRPNR